MGNMDEKYFKEKYIEARDAAFESGKLDKLRQNDGVYTSAMIAALRDMAEAGVYPDGNFSDDECSVWSMFRR